MCSARRNNGPRTPSRTTFANLDSAFVENTLVFLVPKIVIQLIEVVLISPPDELDVSLSYGAVHHSPLLGVEV